jgi:hypothetical protein
MLMIGQTNELSANAVKIAWSERLGRYAPGVHVVRETQASERRRALLDKLSSARPIEILGIDVKPGSRLDTPDFRHSWPSQRDYYRAAVTLERGGALERLAAMTTTDHDLTVSLWRLAPDFDRRAQRVLTGVR